MSVALYVYAQPHACTNDFREQVLVWVLHFKVHASTSVPIERTQVLL